LGIEGSWRSLACNAVAHALDIGCGYGTRLEFTELFNKLAFDDERSGRGDVTGRRGDLAFSLVFGW
jgi:hypothetical protein